MTSAMNPARGLQAPCKSSAYWLQLTSATSDLEWKQPIKFTYLGIDASLFSGSLECDPTGEKGGCMKYFRRYICILMLSVDVYLYDELL